MNIDIIFAICLGITLSAACGFRIFIPPLFLSAASLYGDVVLAPGFEWLGTYPALIAFAIATVTEAIAYYLPVIDNLLDAIEIPTAIAVGTALAASTLGDVDPLIQWTIAAIAGGGTAGIIEGFTVTTRLASTGLTGGTANPLLSTTEILSAATLSLLALTVPLLAAILVLGLLFLGIGRLVKWMRKRKSRNR